MSISKLNFGIPAMTVAVVLTATSPYAIAQVSESKEAKVTRALVLATRTPVLTD